MISCAFENGSQAALRHAVVDCLVINDGKILLVKRAARLLEGGKWGLVGGFAERDETMAQAAARETLEETGWTIKDITLLRINDLPRHTIENRQNVVFVYVAKAVEKIGKPDDESDEQRWFDLSELPNAKEMAFDHMKNIELYQNYLAVSFPLPVLA